MENYFKGLEYLQILIEFLSKLASILQFNIYPLKNEPLNNKIF